MLIEDERCGCVYDDAVMDTTHYPEGHYPIGGSPRSFCKRCDLWKPCMCPEGVSTGRYGEGERSALSEALDGPTPTIDQTPWRALWAWMLRQSESIRRDHR